MVKDKYKNLKILDESNHVEHLYWVKIKNDSIGNHKISDILEKIDGEQKKVQVQMENHITINNKGDIVLKVEEDIVEIYGSLAIIEKILDDIERIVLQNRENL